MMSAQVSRRGAALVRRVGSVALMLALVVLANVLLMQCERHPLDRAGADAVWQRERGK